MAANSSADTAQDSAPDPPRNLTGEQSAGSASAALESISGRGPRDFQRRFIIGGIALVLFAGIVIGFASTATVARQLLAELDADLMATSDRVVSSLDSQGGGMSGPRDRLERPGFQVGTLIAVVGDTEAQGAFINSEGRLVAIDSLALIPLVFQQLEVGEVDTVFLGDGLRETRVVVSEEVSGIRLIVGLQMSDIRQTIARLQVVIFTTTGIVMVAAGLLGVWGFRRGLRPLDQMRKTALTVANQPLDRGDVQLTERVPDQQSRPNREIGQLGYAINRMLDHVGGALRSRERSEQKLRQFVSDASHELRTPLASIRGYSEITLRRADQLPEDVSRSLERIEAESIRMGRLVDDLLLLARLDEGQSGEREDVDLVELATTVVEDAVVRAPGHQHHVVVPEEPVVLQGNRDQLFQALTNLVQNARVHTPGGTTIIVEVIQDQGEAVIRVQDDGPGIPEALQPEIFERFRRADVGRSRKTGSTGLGLAIVNTIVRGHGGHTDLSSVPGHTCFSIHLPITTSANSSS